MATERNWVSYKTWFTLAVQKKALENLPVVLDQGSISAFQINGKRKLIVDEVKAIAGEEIGEEQLQ